MLSEINRRLLDDFECRIVDTLTIIRPEIDKSFVEEYLKSICIFVDNNEESEYNSYSSYPKEDIDYANRKEGISWNFDQD